MGTPEDNAVSDESKEEETPKEEDDTYVFGFSGIDMELDNDEGVKCAILTLFEAADKEYIALLPMDEDGNTEEGDVYLYGVSLLTMHGAKGLEYELVFVIAANEGSTPYRKAKQKEEIEEERRMFV